MRSLVVDMVGEVVYGECVWSVCGGLVLGCVIWGREENKNYFSFGSIGYLG